MNFDNLIYRNNPYLKKDNVQIEYTKEQIEEYIKCSQDVVYFIENYCKIITLDHGIQLFKPYEYQKRMVQAFDSYRFVVNLLPRQMGKTTILAGYILHYAIFNPAKAIGVLANKAATAREILSRIQRMYENLPFWLQPGVKEWNKSTMILSNDSSIVSAATSSSSVRGLSLNFIYLDEFAHVQGQVEFWESTYPVISSGSDSKVIITSTPKGLDLFYKIYNEAEQKINDFYPVKVHWSEHPKRDEAWKEQTLRNIGDLQFQQEFGCDFLGSSGTLISGAVLQKLTHKQPIQETLEVKQYVAPKTGHSYVVVADVSRGKGLDYSAAQIIDVTQMPYEQVAVYRSNLVTPTDYSKELHMLTKLYNNATVLVETNDIGGQVADILYDDYEVENLVFTENKGARGKTISFGGKSAEKGIRTSKTVKSVGCSILKLLVEQQQLIINDYETIHELSVFSKKGNSYEAEKGEHDDLVMSLVLFSWLSDQKYFRELTDINTLQNIRDKTDAEMEEKMLTIGYHHDGTEEYEEDTVTYGGYMSDDFEVYKDLLNDF